MQPDHSTVTAPKPSADHASGQTVEDVIIWLNAMGERGIYHATTARLATSSINQLISVLGEEEARDAKAVLDNLDSLGDRLCRLKNAVPATVKTYISRAKLALADYVQYRANPTGFKARTSPLRGTKSEEKKKKAPSAIEKKPEAQLETVDCTVNLPSVAGPVGFDLALSPGRKGLRDFPLSDGREIVYMLPEKLTMREFFKFMCHAAPLIEDFDVSNENHLQVFALARAERAHHTS